MKAKFIFQGWDADLEGGEIAFHFTIMQADKKIDFTEKIFFPSVKNSQIPPQLLKTLLDNLMIILGISYWKTFCPRNIELKSVVLTKDQAEFWNIVYTKGLGEFFYKNKIDFRGLVNFPYVDEEGKHLNDIYHLSERSLLMLGGGKDSIVSGELLKSKNKPFDILTVGASKVQEEVAKVMGKKPIVIMRHLDPKLFKLNNNGKAYNGHIPISVVYAFLGLLAAPIYDYSSVIVSNEKSANYGNVEYLGEIVNHQWSKSEEFEKLFQQHIARFVTPDISYFSPLRSFSELDIAKLFSQHKKYFPVFSSCNRNFKINGAQRPAQGLWCGKCAKCLFVFISLAAFVKKEEIMAIFGNNLLDDKSLLSLFKELLGLQNVKPFECVGTPQEVKMALSKIATKGEFDSAYLMKFFLNQ